MKYEYKIELFNRSDVPFKTVPLESDHVLSADSEDFAMSMIASEYDYSQFNAISITRVS